MKDKKYAERDAYEIDMAGGYYSRHVSAMTSEQLHAKSDIAAELGHRDMVIDKLNSALKHLVEVYDDPTGKQWTTTSKREALDKAREAINLALGE